MAKNNKKGGEDKEGEDAKPPKKGRLSASLLLMLLLTASVVTVLFLISPPAREKALGHLAGLRTGAAALLSEEPNREERPAVRGGGDALRLQNNLAAKFTELELRESDYEIRHFPDKDSIAIRAAIPRGRPIEWIVWELTSAARGTQFEVEDGVCAQSARMNCTITFRSKNTRHPAIVLNVTQSNRYFSNTGRMAILVEDFGFEANQTTIEYLSFPDPLTISLVPARKLTAWTAQIANEYKKEIVLSLPMEPLPPQLAGQYRQSTITIHASEERIRGIIAQAAADVPNFSGIANFHGTRAMEDSRVMRIVLSEALRRRAYFVYVYSDPLRRSVVPQLVREMGVPSQPVQITIGADHTAEQARDILRRGAIAAEHSGRVLIKTAPTTAFITALKEEREALGRNGIRLVYVSELM
jgi:polysaccharide deacetylase 2 family uncharacterized protein YibQ